jgi:TRAP-type uncharacterized transport system fused permease subunit
MVGYLITRASAAERVILVAAALVLIKPGLWTDATGLALVALALGLQFASSRRVAREGAAT